MKEYGSLPGGDGASHPYTKIDDRLLFDTRLSPAALGVMVFLLGQEDDVNLENLQAQLNARFTASKRCISDAMRLLMQLGYLVPILRKQRDGSAPVASFKVFERPHPDFLEGRDGPFDPITVNPIN